MTAFLLTPPNERVRCVGSFHELVTARFADGINALCWPRTLPGDFGEVMTGLRTTKEVATIDDETLRDLTVTPAGAAAVTILLEDLQRLRERGLAPVLDCIRKYPQDEDDEVLPTDVYSFHADRATVEADTYLCTYYGAPSEGLRNADARRHVDIPETRARLRQLYGGDDEEGFREFLAERCYDLHYAAAPSARPFSFGVGNLWRIATEYPESPVPPCIHRAPPPVPGQPVRLLLIS